MTKLIWDFNGTIFNDVDAGFLTINEMLSERDLPILDSISTYRKIFGFPIKNYYIRAGFDFKNESYEEIAQCYIPIYNKYAASSNLTIGIKDLLCDIKSQYEMYVLSACEQNMLKKYLDRYEITGYFKNIYGISDHLAAGKLNAAERMFKDIGTEDVILIGDSVHDKEIADKYRSKCILVSWGHEDFDRLANANKIVCNNPNELKNILQKGF